ncbi:MAG: hypothetical protein HY280_02050 [Nitrospinae bacterium]|nr:hypothetical protein [Nitrospinota bacterium]
MTLDEIREIAQVHGIQSLHRFERKEELVWTIQLAEGFSDCFRRSNDCTNEKCAWFEDCIKNPTSQD